MERRGFLKLLGFGAVAAGVVSAGIGEAQAAPSAAPAEAKGVDQFLDELTAANKGDGEFAQRYYRRRVYYARPRYRRVYYRRPVYYARPRRCRWVPGIFGPVWRCW